RSESFGEQFIARRIGVWCARGIGSRGVCRQTGASDTLVSGGHAPSGPIRHTARCGKVAKLNQANDVGTGRCHTFGGVAYPGLCAIVTVGPTRAPAVCKPSSAGS